MITAGNFCMEFPFKYPKVFLRKGKVSRHHAFALAWLVHSRLEVWVMEMVAELFQLGNGPCQADGSSCYQS